LRKVDSVGRETPSTDAAAATVKPRGSMISVFTNSPAPEVAMKVLRRVAEGVASEARLERAPTREARSIAIMLAPAGSPGQAPAAVASASGRTANSSGGNKG
jgi:hypothetical protein